MLLSVTSVATTKAKALEDSNGTVDIKVPRASWFRETRREDKILVAINPFDY
jgi:hypothetical protein